MRCQQKNNYSTNKWKHLLVGSYFCTHVFRLLNFDMNDVVLFNKKYFFLVSIIYNRDLLFDFPQKKNLPINRTYNICHIFDFKCVFGLGWKMKIISLFSLFLLLFIGSITLLALFMGPTVLFQLIFTFIYSTFINNFSVSTK